MLSVWERFQACLTCVTDRVNRTGSAIKHILITRAVVRRESPPTYLPRGQQQRFYALIAAEEEAWDAEKRGDNSKPEKPDFSSRGGGGGANAHGDGDEGDGGSVGSESQSFEEYREKAKVAGSV